ncbi:MAG: 50S ribosomal protein L30 [Candidatus Omnitrophota bacterium]|jgi:large subunit ribosomal protein L30|nr:MAG: 50S ribosomal protein L30 [Candidatus Omnitrophota bacterium]
MARKLEITLLRSPIGRVPRHKKTVKALGLRRPLKSVVITDSPQVRGMIKSIEFMVSVREVD